MQRNMAKYLLIRDGHMKENLTLKIYVANVNTVVTKFVMNTLYIILNRDI